MSNNIKLSYFITTYNKLPYLQEVLKRLIATKKDDEEIIVTDGGSSDGTPEYLAKLHKEGKIDQWLSESDKGESHGSNKALLMARGELIKLLTDDDAFYHPNIQECKTYMLEHKDIDILTTEGLSVHWTREQHATKSMYANEYRRWKEESRPFGFCGLGIMMRRSSLPLLGLFDPSFARMDAEYSMRVTSGKALVGFYDGYSWARIMNPQSVSRNRLQRLNVETEALDLFYSKLNNETETLQIDPMTTFGKIKTYLRPLKRALVGKKKKDPKALKRDIAEDFKTVDTWLKDLNDKKPGKFL